MSSDYNYPPPPLFTDEESAAIGEAFDKTFTSAPFTPNPGDQYRDDQGDTWTVLADGRVRWDKSEDSACPLTETFSDFAAEYGPITKIETDEDKSKLHELVDAARALGNEVDSRDVPECPDYYRFPCGAQVIEVSRYLTSNAGQAVQYIARSSRIDGVTKGDPLPDLRKAADMLADEIARLEAA